MVSLSQIQLLEQKIESAITKIGTLTEENKKLTEQYESTKAENTNLVNKLNELQSNQGRIEQGILNALHRLETVENTIIETVQTTQSATQSTAQSAAQSASQNTVQSTPQPSSPEQPPQFDIF
jgi:predicted nuclease with TOPRIM domain